LLFVPDFLCVTKLPKSRKVASWLLKDVSSFWSRFVPARETGKVMQKRQGAPIS
jgi:hypothetical protein